MKRFIFYNSAVIDIRFSMGAKSFTVILVLILSGIMLYANLAGEELQIRKEIVLKKVLQISDADANFIFKYPENICADEKDNIYILDDQRILKFSPTGQYLDNLIGKGQGPGEATHISNFCTAGEKIIIHNNYPARIIRKDLAGKFLDEFRLAKPDWITFVHYFNGRYYFSKPEDLGQKGNIDGRIIDINQVFFSLSADGKNRIDVIALPFTVFAYNSVGGGGGWLGMGSIQYVFHAGRYMFVSHLIKYNIKCVDLQDRKILYDFGVKYSPREIPASLSERWRPGKLNINGKIFQPPASKYFNDIQRLLLYDNHLWVVTSTVKQSKGVRVDRYGLKGEYIDSFYLFLPGHTDMYSFDWYIYGRYLYSVEVNNDGDISIMKYEINQLIL